MQKLYHEIFPLSVLKYLIDIDYQNQLFQKKISRMPDARIRRKCCHDVECDKMSISCWLERHAPVFRLSSQIPTVETVTWG